MPEQAFFVVILAALSGLYWGLWKVHGCQKRIEGRLDSFGKKKR